MALPNTRRNYYSFLKCIKIQPSQNAYVNFMQVLDWHFSLENCPLNLPFVPTFIRVLLHFHSSLVNVTQYILQTKNKYQAPSKSRDNLTMAKN